MKSAAGLLEEDEHASAYADRESLPVPHSLSNVRARAPTKPDPRSMSRLSAGSPSRNGSGASTRSPFNSGATSAGPGILPLWTRNYTRFTSGRLPLLNSLLLILLGVLLSPLLGSLLRTLHSSISPGPLPPPFHVSPDLFWPLPALPETPWYPPPRPDADPDAIPNVLHYIYGYKDPLEGAQEVGELLPYYAYLAIRSAIVNVEPDAIYFHYKHLPRGPFFDLLKPYLTLLPTPAPDEIYGRKIHHFAHKSDVVRLQALQASGGIYLDIDVFVIRPMKILMKYDVVMAMEASPNSQRPPLDPEGLCNAVILSRPHSRFIDRWLESYKSFDSNDWPGHSVRKPWELARRHPDEITVLDERAFFWPLWEGSGEESRIRYVHEGTEHDFHASEQFAYHLWESLAMGYLEKLSPDSLRKSETSFGKMAKKFVTLADDEAYRQWVAMKG